MRLEFLHTGWIRHASATTSGRQRTDRSAGAFRSPRRDLQRLGAFGLRAPAKSCVTTPMRGAGTDAQQQFGPPGHRGKPRATSSTPAANRPTVSSVHE